RVQRLSLLGFRVPGSAGPRRECQRRGHSTHSAGERRLGARYGGGRADRAGAHGRLRGLMHSLVAARVLEAWDNGWGAVVPRRMLMLLAALDPDVEMDTLADLTPGKADRRPIAARRQVVGS